MGQTSQNLDKEEMELRQQISDVEDQINQIQRVLLPQFVLAREKAVQKIGDYTGDASDLDAEIQSDIDNHKQMVEEILEYEKTIAATK